MSKLVEPLADLDAEVSAKSVVVAALTWPTEAWLAQAFDWLDQGVEIDAEIADALERVAAREHYCQPNRHKAFALAKRWHRTHEQRA